MKLRLRHIINTVAWWMAGAMFTYGVIVFSGSLATDPEITWAGRLLLFALVLPLWPVALGGLVSGLVYP